MTGRAIGYAKNVSRRVDSNTGRARRQHDLCRARHSTCEGALKKAVLNRKNAYFYKTQFGAEVGDLYMSLIHTAERCATSPFEYLRALLGNAAAVAAAPEAWMPWNYASTLT